MDLTTTISPTTNLDTENETPPVKTTQPNSNSTKSLSFTNGAPKKHSQNHHHAQPPAVEAVAYKECLRNHAASLGGHAVDGCGEFMLPSPTTTSDPTELKCAACGCHRNFHRRGDDPTAITTLIFPPLIPPPPPPPLRRRSPSSSPSPPPPPPPPPQPRYYSSAPHMLMALSAAGEQPPANNHAVATPVTPTGAKGEGENPSGGRKRFRSKFSQDQKEKMFSFSEKLGWKMHKCDEGLVEEFCSGIGVGKGVLKVWMHNNKHTLGKRHINSIRKDSNGNKFDAKTTNESDHGHSDSNNGFHPHVSTSGSPSSA